MSKYAGKKNDELMSLCKDRGLAHTGKKADLVKRLEDDDAKQPTGASAAAKPTAIEDEIDWDEEPAAEIAKSATTEAAANAIAAGGQGEVGNPQAVPNQEAAIDPAQTADLKVESAPANATAAANTDEDAKKAEAAAKKAEEDAKYKAGLVERTLEEEIEKRKARARKFGMPEDTEEIKALERAKRFGTTDLPGLLNKALPDKKEREPKKRGREGGDKDGNDRKRSRVRQENSKKDGGQKAKAEKTAKVEKTGGLPSWMTDADKAKAEARKAKFASA